ncbi:MAG: SsrA-binding protein SmpB [Bacillota bacterium]
MVQEKIVTVNRKASHDYFIEETYVAGISLKGTEVKSLRAGRSNLKDSYAQVQNGEIYLHQMHISLYEQGNRYNHDPVRPRRLLMHKAEINRLAGKVREKGLTLVPLKVFFNERGKAKVELALARGKKDYDKREVLAAKDARREIEKAFRERQKV